MQLPDPFYDLDGQVAIDLEGARAVFTTRSWGDVRETLPKIATQLGVFATRPKQVHGTVVVSAEEVGPGTEADAVIATRAGVAPAVIAADCLPIVIAGQGVVAAVHAGWRGLESGVISRTLAALRARVDRSSANAFIAAIGPAAGACCYEVGPELHARFDGFSRQGNLDLEAIARGQLEAAGITEIHDCGICTICSTNPALFSYRREGEAAGRQALIAWLT